MSEEQAQNFIEQATQSLQSGQLNQALDFANQAILLNPEQADAYVIKAVALAQLNQAADATRAFEDALRIQPDNAKTRFNLAVHLVRQNQKTEALTQVQEALKIDPSHVGARELLGQLESELGLRSAGEAAPPVQGMGQEQTANQPYGAGQNPYQQGPYAGGQQPYYQRPASAHNLPFVEQMGPAWTIIGWAFVAVWLILFLVQIPMMIEAFQFAMRNPGQPPQQNQNTALAIIGIINLVGALTWMIMDILDRRASWFWLIPFILCCCCFFYGPVHSLYMLFGRKPK